MTDLAHAYFQGIISACASSSRYNRDCRMYDEVYIGNPGGVPYCSYKGVLEDFDCSKCDGPKQQQKNAESPSRLVESIGNLLDICGYRFSVRCNCECPLFEHCKNNFTKRRI